MAKKGKLIGIGVGPGDTELLTLKAAKVLETVPVVFSPKSSKEKESIALSIVRPVLEKRKDYKRLMLVEPIFPMIEDKKELEKVWTSASEMIAQYLDSGRDVAFITLGDSSIFSTYSYVQKKLIGRYEIETIPGITSFTAIEEKNRPKEIYSVENCTRENEKIIEGFSNEKPYLTTTIIKFGDD